MGICVPANSTLVRKSNVHDKSTGQAKPSSPEIRSSSLLDARVLANSTTPNWENGKNSVCSGASVRQKPLLNSELVFRLLFSRKVWDTAPSILRGQRCPRGTTFGTHPLVLRFLDGMFELKPSLPQYNTSWNVSVVLRYLKTSQPAPLSLKVLTLKLTSLLCLLSGQRRQTLSKLRIDCMQTLPDSYGVYHMQTAI